MVNNCKLLYIGYILSIFTACDSGKSKSELTVKNEAASASLASKYQAVNNWDTTNYYSITLQRIFIEKSKSMLFKGRIYDIIKVDSNYVIKILNDREDLFRNYLAMVNCTKQQYEQIHDSAPQIEGSFVIKISKITSSNPSIKTEESNNGEDSYTYNHLSDDKDQMVTVFHGQLIDYFLDKIDFDK